MRIHSLFVFYPLSAVSIFSACSFEYQKPPGTGAAGNISGAHSGGKSPPDAGQGGSVTGGLSGRGGTQNTGGVVTGGITSGGAPGSAGKTQNTGGVATGGITSGGAPGSAGKTQNTGGIGTAGITNGGASGSAGKTQNTGGIGTAGITNGGAPGSGAGGSVAGTSGGGATSTGGRAGSAGTSGGNTTVQGGSAGKAGAGGTGGADLTDTLCKAVVARDQQLFPIVGCSGTPPSPEKSLEDCKFFAKPACKSEFSVYINCYIALPDSAFECSPVTNAVAEKQTECVTERTAFLDCFISK